MITPNIISGGELETMRDNILLLIIMNTIKKNSGIEKLTIKEKGNNTVAHIAT